jgi:MoxR-like ATPase
MAKPALLHRVILSPEMEIEGWQPARAIADVVDRVEAPRA